MKKRALCPLSGVHLTIKPIFFVILFLLIRVHSLPFLFFENGYHILILFEVSDIIGFIAYFNGEKNGIKKAGI